MQDPRKIVLSVLMVGVAMVGLAGCGPSVWERSFSFEPEASEPGDIVKHTTDLNSFAGTAMMAHADPEVLDADYRRLRELQSTMFEVLEEEEALETV